MFLESFACIEQWMSGNSPEHSVKPANVVCDLQPISAKKR
jgi:hypothetical protein